MQQIATSRFTFDGSFVYRTILTESNVNTYYDILKQVDIKPFAQGVVRSEPIANANVRPKANFAKCEYGYVTLDLTYKYNKVKLPAIIVPNALITIKSMLSIFIE